jgi:predicted ester cyclase
VLGSEFDDAGREATLKKYRPVGKGRFAGYYAENYVSTGEHRDASARFPSIQSQGHRWILCDVQQFRHPPRIFQPHPSGLTGLKEHYANLFRGFPDLTVDIDDIIAEGEKVAHRFTFRGTHRGEFLGIPPTGNLVTAPGMQMNLFSGGKCIEVWSVHDSFRFLSQIGAVPKFRDMAAK